MFGHSEWCWQWCSATPLGPTSSPSIVLEARALVESVPPSLHIEAIATLIFRYRYQLHLWKKYPVSSDGPDQQRLLDKAKTILGSPLAWYQQLPEKGTTGQATTQPR